MRTIGGSIALVLAMAMVFGRQAAADVVLDGSIDGQDPYMYILSDPVEGSFESPSWDVQRVCILQGQQGLFIGVDTVGAFDRDGGLTSSSGRTDVYLEFRQYWGGAVMQSDEMVLTATDGTFYWNGIETTLARYAVGTDLEIEYSGIMRNDLDMILTGHGKCRFYLRLDDTGTGLHDEVYGIIPEPGTLGLLALGAIGMFRRRVQRTARPTCPARW